MLNLHLKTPKSEITIPVKEELLQAVSMGVQTVAEETTEAHLFELVKTMIVDQGKEVPDGINLTELLQVHRELFGAAATEAVTIVTTQTMRALLSLETARRLCHLLLGFELRVDCL